MANGAGGRVDGERRRQRSQGRTVQAKESMADSIGRGVDSRQHGQSRSPVVTA